MAKKRRKRNRPRSTEQLAIRKRIENCSAPAELARLGNQLLMEEPALAARAYRKALKSCSNDATLLNNLGVAHWHMGHKGEARRLFEIAASLATGDASILQNYAGALVDHGQTDRARHVFSKSTGLKPGPDTYPAYIDLQGY